MKTIKDVDELLQSGIINQDTADKISAYYAERERKTATLSVNAGQNRYTVVFGILGALLTGLGIILIVAHNWDTFSRSTKTTFAFLPLLLGQALCAFTLLKRNDSNTWREGSSVFLFFAMGGSISLVSQVYNIPGDISSFILSWSLLCLPLVYLMRSSAVSILYIIFIGYYIRYNAFDDYSGFNSGLLVHWQYWLLWSAILPHYYMLFRNRPQGGFIGFHHWLVPSLFILILTISSFLRFGPSTNVIIAFMSLFSVFSIIGEAAYFKTVSARNNAYRIIGELGTLSLLLFMSTIESRYWFQAFNFGSITSVFVLTGIALLIIKYRQGLMSTVKIREVSFLIFIALILVGMISIPLMILLINLKVLAMGVITIRQGVKQNHLGILNYGFMIVMALVVVKFFDQNLPFVLKGSLFILAGIGFVAANIIMVKKRKSHE